MRLVLTLAAGGVQSLQSALTPALEAVAASGRRIAGTEILGEGAMDIFIDGGDLERLRQAVDQALEHHAVDFCIQREAGRRKRLLIADMDSTIIDCECLDELADFAGLKGEIAAITAKAMAGEIPFDAALRERVVRLAGLPLATLERVYAERVRLNRGAETLVRVMSGADARCVLVSGGFDFFTRRVAAAAGFAAYRANRLLDDGVALTGRVAEPILGADAKLAILTQEAKLAGVDLAETLAIGDGANDLPMIRAAGLGIAWQAKPILAQAADARIDHGDLKTALYFQGYPPG